MATHSSVLAWRIPGRDGGAWWAAVYGVAQSWTQLKRLRSSSSHAPGFNKPRWMVLGREYTVSTEPSLSSSH